MNQHAIDALEEALRAAESALVDCQNALRWQANEISADATFLIDDPKCEATVERIDNRAAEINRLAGVHADHIARRDGLRTALAALRETR